MLQEYSDDLYLEMLIYVATHGITRMIYEKSRSDAEEVMIVKLKKLLKRD